MTPAEPPMERLVLHPQDPEAALPDPAALARGLAAAGFLDAAAPAAAGAGYPPGPRFMHWLGFLGCSPALPGTGDTGPAAIIHLECRPVPDFLGGDRVRPPRCPGCGKSEPHWPAMVSAWRRQGARAWPCPACGRRSPMTAWNWRRSAGFGRCHMRIDGIAEGLARPGEPFLELLARLSGVEWRYFFYRG